jgi:hypothetical protein
MGDETIANFGTPGFLFGDEAYGALGVVSDGYVVVGGGTSSDVNYIPQDIPDASAPNNVLAPYWTDLNPGAGGAVRIATLTDGVDVWIVVDWEGVPVYGTALLRSFQVWIQVGATEGIWFEYDTGAGAPGAGSSDGLIVGAENRDGSSAKSLGMDVVPSTGGYEVIAGSPTPGGSVTIDYDVLGRRVGSSSLHAFMESDIVAGVTKINTPLSVTP